MKIIDINKLFEAQQELFEVEMSPSNLKRLASQVDARVGMEFEMIVPDVDDEDYEDQEPEEDYERDERADDIDDIVNFFSSDDDYMGQVNDPSSIREMEEELREKFYEYINEEIRRMWVDGDGKQYFADWVRENVDPEEVADFAETPEDLFGERNPSKEDYVEFIEQQWDEEGSYYDDAYEAFADEKRDEGDFSERDFLRDIGIEDMSDVNRNIRGYISWPFYHTPYNEYGGGESIEAVGDEFSDAIGKRVYSSTSYHGARRSEDAYSLEPDSSINAESGEAGLEFISPPMPVDEMFDDLRKVKAWAEKRGCYTNKSTGLHINVSIPNYSLDNLDYVKLAVLLGDKYVLDQFGRIGTQWAKSALDIVKDRAKDRPEDADRLLAQVKSGVEQIASKLLHSGRTDKYTSINTKDNYVEFRSAGGDWLDANFDKIENTLLRFVVALDAACDPEKYKKEYLKGLYKLLKPKDPSSDMSLFAKYMAGQITRSELVNNIESTRKQRFRGKGIGIIQKDQVEEGDWVVEYDDGDGKPYVIYIAKNDAVPTEGAAWRVAQKYKPQWFKPDTLEYITVTPFTYGEEIDKLNLYRAEYGHKYTSVVAPDEETAKENVRIMDADYFTSYPDTNITLDKEEASKRQISQMLDWQDNKLKIGQEYIKRPKIWRATGRSNYAGRYYIAAITRDEAIDVAKRLDPDMAESDNFEVYVNDAYPDADTYEAYVRAQNDMIQQREADQERLRADQEAQDADIDISKLKVYRVTNTELNNAYKYVVAENGGEAAEIASKLDPNMFGYIPSLTVQDQSHLSTTSNPALIKSMYHSQQQTLNSNRDTSRGQVSSTAQKIKDNDTVEVVAEFPDLIGKQGKVLSVSPDYDFVRVILYGEYGITRFPVSALKKIEDINIPAEFTGQETAPRISDLRRFMVTNNDDPNSGSVNIAATSIDDAIARARQAQPAWATAGLYARPLG